MKKIIFAAICLLSFRLTAAAYNTYAPNSWDTVKKKPGTIRPFTTFVKKAAHRTMTETFSTGEALQGMNLPPF